MDRKYFLQLDEHLKSEIKDGIKLSENDALGAIMHQISFCSCLILRMKRVAYRNQLIEPYRDERTEYFDGIEAILGILYSECYNLPFEKKIKMCANTSFTPRTNKERFEAMKNMKEIMPKLKTSWVEKA